MAQTTHDDLWARLGGDERFILGLLNRTAGAACSAMLHQFLIGNDAPRVALDYFTTRRIAHICDLLETKKVASSMWATSGQDNSPPPLWHINDLGRQLIQENKYL